jgi:glycosyltransferase
MAPKVTIITVVHNRREDIAGCIESVLAQTYQPLEYIVLDGGSSDGTLDIVRSYGARISRVISEIDRGCYHAMNKGIGLASGDIISFLHADDLYAGPGVVADVVKAMADSGADGLYGDLVYVAKNDPEKIVRWWKAGAFTENSIRRGWMPPHPTFFAKKSVYEKFGGFDESYRIAADYDWMLRLLYKEKIRAVYLPEVLIRMKWGGMSNRNLVNILLKSFEDYKVCRRFGLGMGTLWLKNFSKLAQFFRRKG